MSSSKRQYANTFFQVIKLSMKGLTLVVARANEIKHDTKEAAMENAQAEPKSPDSIILVGEFKTTKNKTVWVASHSLSKERKTTT
jgi:hypothetical protein